jgi:hypothetical protein
MALALAGLREELEALPELVVRAESAVEAAGGEVATSSCGDFVARIRGERQASMKWA